MADMPSGMDWSEYFASMKRRPAIIAKDETQLEFQTLERNEQVVDYDGRMLVIDIHTFRVTTKAIVIREYDPETSYSDALKEFIDEGNGEK